MNNYIGIFKHFFLLGCISFGGPAAHIGYFHQRFVQKLRWLTQEEYGQIVALSQFLPGPSSSQVGFAIGYKQGGGLGALAAFIAFTFPSIVLMLVLAQLSHQLVDSSYFYGITHGLKLLAVVVVADAVYTMFNSFCKSNITRTIAILSAVFLLISSSLVSQMVVLIIAALIGITFLRNDALESTQKVQLSWLPLLIFIVLLILLPALANNASEWSIAAQFYQAGSMVFGGAHVVLPLLQNLLADQLSTDTFLTGYAAVQAVPGPMFTLATYLGFHLSPAFPIVGALTATLAMFLPGLLLMLTFLRHWQILANMPKLAGAMQAINAAVVGLLLSALYLPVFHSSVLDATDMALVILGFYLLKQLKIPIIVLVFGFALAGMLLTFI